MKIGPTAAVSRTDSFAAAPTVDRRQTMSLPLRFIWSGLDGLMPPLAVSGHR